MKANTVRSFTLGSVGLPERPQGLPIHCPDTTPYRAAAPAKLALREAEAGPLTTKVAILRTRLSGG